MKRLHKYLSLFLAFVLMAGMTLPVSASSPQAPPVQYTLTIANSNPGHTYEAYQIFGGVLSDDGVLSDIQWGTGVAEDALLTDLKADETVGSAFASCTTAADVAKAVTEFGDNSEELDAFAAAVGENLGTSAGIADAPSGGAYTITGLDAGYYFVQDAIDVTGPDASTKFVLRLVQDTEVTPKSGTPAVEKKVLEDSYAENGGYGTGWNDVADYSIGEDISFRLIGTLHGYYGDYDSYAYTFHDTVSPGLTVDMESIAVYAATDKEGSDKTPITGWQSTETDDGFDISFADLKRASGAVITKDSFILVEYTASLNGNAVVGLNGNTNAVTLDFSNNPNPGGEGSLGTTTSDTVILFTYGLDVTKVDGEVASKTLPGAQFTLQDADGNYVVVDGNGKVTGWTASAEDASTLISGEDGKFRVYGLDEGTYMLHEVQPPDGYNRLKEDVELVINAATANGQNYSGTPSEALTAVSITVDDGEAEQGNASAGTVGATVRNNAGVTFPETGGIGTWLFYGIGAVVMIGAVVFLVRRKRAAK